MVYISLSSSSDDFSQPFPHGEKKVLAVCLSLVGTFIFRVVAPSSPITLIPFPITITNPIQSDPMAGLFQKVWNHTRKDSKSIYGRSSLDAGHRSSHKRPLQYIDEGNFCPHLLLLLPLLTHHDNKQRKIWPETNQKFFFWFFSLSRLEIPLKRQTNAKSLRIHDYQKHGHYTANVR